MKVRSAFLNGSMVIYRVGHKCTNGSKSTNAKLLVRAKFFRALDYGKYGLQRIGVVTPNDLICLDNASLSTSGRSIAVTSIDNKGIGRSGGFDTTFATVRINCCTIS